MNHTTSDWVRAHEVLLEIARERAALDAKEAPALLRARRAAVHVHLGFASFHQYAEQLFGYSFRTIEDKLRVAEALESLPELTRALASGEASWCCARELSRVATAETETEWLRAAAGRSAREVERLVSGRQQGDRPVDRPRPDAQRHVLRFEVAAETLATFRDALQRLRQDASEPLDDDSVLLLLARQVLEGPQARGTSSYQVSVQLCPECGRAHQRCAGDRVEIDGSVLDLACCDAEHATHVGEATAATQPESIPRSIRRQVLSRDGGRCVVPGCRHSTFIDVHHIDPRCDGGLHTPENLIVLCVAHHRAAHRGQLSITGNATSLRFQRADGSAYGTNIDAAAIAVAEKVLRGLRNLGFGEKEARWAVQQAAADLGSTPPTPQSLLRTALQALGARRAAA
jgi:hypothetical protein